MDRTERFYRIDALLREREVVSGSRPFFAELEISRATFKRDLEYLRDRLHAPITWDREARGYRFTEPAPSAPRYALPGLWLNEAEIRALLALRELLEKVHPGLLGPHVEPLMERARALLGSDGGASSEVARRVRILHAPRREVRSVGVRDHLRGAARPPPGARRPLQPAARRDPRTHPVAAATRALSRELVPRCLVPPTERPSQLRPRLRPPRGGGRRARARDRGLHPRPGPRRRLRDLRRSGASADRPPPVLRDAGALGGGRGVALAPGRRPSTRAAATSSRCPTPMRASSS